MNPINRQARRPTRGGTAQLVVYRADTTETVQCLAEVLPARGLTEFQSTRERETTGAGTLHERARTDRFAALIADRAAVEVLEAWKEQGAQVMALVIGMSEAQHTLWQEPVPILLDKSGAGFGEFEGHTLTLHTEAFDARTELSDDLFALDAWEDLTGDGIADGWRLAGGADVSFVGSGALGTQGLTAGVDASGVLYRDYTIPAPGARLRFAVELYGGMPGPVLTPPLGTRRVYVTVQALAAGQAEAAFGDADVLHEVREQVFDEGMRVGEIVLPDGAYTLRVAVEVEGGETGLPEVVFGRPRLYTRRVVEGPLITGGFYLISEDATSVELEPFGAAEVRGSVVTRTFMGETYQVPVATLGPPNLLAFLSQGGALPTSLPGEHDHRFRLRVYPQPE